MTNKINYKSPEYTVWYRDWKKKYSDQVKKLKTNNEDMCETILWLKSDMFYMERWIKVVVVTASILLIISIGINIYQFIY